MIRKPVVAGHFYHGSEKALSHQVESLLDRPAETFDAIGAVSPHAGYDYSGPVAGSVLAAMKPRPVYVILGPNHTGSGSPFSLTASDVWKTPLGDVEVDKVLSARIRNDSRHIKVDELAHAAEHSIEVQIPFLQLVNRDFRIVPIVISYASLETYRAIGKELARFIKESGLEKDAAIIASSDMTHYEPHDEAKAKDSKAIEAILKLDEALLIDSVERFDITMCGAAPTAIMLAAAKELGAGSARLIRYQTSGDTSGDYSSVVGYAGILIT